MLLTFSIPNRFASGPSSEATASEAAAAGAVEGPALEFEADVEAGLAVEEGPALEDDGMLAD